MVNGANIIRCKRTGMAVCVKLGGGSCVCDTVEDCPFKLLERKPQPKP